MPAAVAATLAAPRRNRACCGDARIHPDPMTPLSGGFDIAIVAVVVLCLGVLTWPRLRAWPAWRAAITPLASIIGSGFLVIGPILAHLAGGQAVAAMLGLCVLAWMFGSAIRRNIAALDEPELHPRARSAAFRRWDGVAEVALAIAYFVSVAYYLNLLGAFLLKGFDIVDLTSARAVTSVCVIGLGTLGMLRGFRGIERVEVFAVSLKLAVIAGLLCALTAAHVVHDLPAPPQAAEHDAVTLMRTLLGCVLLVQGFETSRFLGATYDAQTRIRSMRHAQLLAGAIYVGFIFLVLPLIPAGAVDQGSETEIVDVVGKVARVLGPILVAAALASQLSAAVADMGGAGGLVAEFSRGRLTPARAYLLITVVVLVLTWTTDLFRIITFASQAFAAYYAIQCGLAAWLDTGRPLRCALHVLSCLVALAVVLFALPAGG